MMINLSQQQFNDLVSEGIDAISDKYQAYLKNVAFVVELEPNADQRRQLNLRDHETLFGLYEGVPLPARGGVGQLPDKITIFKLPLERVSKDLNELKERVRNTVWHEVAHYFGLDHSRINELQKKP